MATTAQYAPATTTVGGSAWKIYEEKQSTRIKINKVSLETLSEPGGKKRQQKKENSQAISNLYRVYTHEWSG